MYRANVYITLRKSILDPKGKATQHALHSLGFNNIKKTRIGKFIEIDIDAENVQTAKDIANNAAEKLLANLVMEDYSIELEKID